MAQHAEVQASARGGSRREGRAHECIHTSLLRYADGNSSEVREDDDLEVEDVCDGQRPLTPRYLSSISLSAYRAAGASPE
eukprot:2506756-Rhodomonas_salina.1